MTPDQARSMYRRQIDAHGETITLRKGHAGAEISVRARVSGYTPEQLVGPIAIGSRRIIVMAGDVPGSWGVPQKNDRVVWNGVTLTIQDVDASTRRIAGETIAYDMRATGA